MSSSCRLLLVTPTHPWLPRLNLLPVARQSSALLAQLDSAPDFESVFGNSNLSERVTRTDILCTTVLLAGTFA
jgi:hypothetical protein